MLCITNHQGNAHIEENRDREHREYFSQILEIFINLSLPLTSTDKWMLQDCLKVFFEKIRDNNGIYCSHCDAGGFFKKDRNWETTTSALNTFESLL